MLWLASMQTMQPFSVSAAVFIMSSSCLVFPSPFPLMISLTI